VGADLSLCLLRSQIWPKLNGLRRDYGTNLISCSRNARQANKQAVSQNASSSVDLGCASLGFLFFNNASAAPGLDAAGKTTVLYGMALGEVITTIPTIGFNVETVPLGSNLEAQCWDVGGCDKIRPLYRHYFQCTDACVWVVDSNDCERVEESVEECVIVVKELQITCKSTLPFLM
jgi:hypothetical protein